MVLAMTDQAQTPKAGVSKSGAKPHKPTGRERSIAFSRAAHHRYQPNRDFTREEKLQIRVGKSIEKTLRRIGGHEDLSGMASLIREGSRRRNPHRGHWGDRHQGGVNAKYPDGRAGILKRRRYAVIEASRKCSHTRKGVKFATLRNVLWNVPLSDGDAAATCDAA
jgi:hypothetical protein